MERTVVEMHLKIAYTYVLHAINLEFVPSSSKELANFIRRLPGLKYPLPDHWPRRWAGAPLSGSWAKNAAFP